MHVTMRPSSLSCVFTHCLLLALCCTTLQGHNHRNRNSANARQRTTSSKPRMNAPCGSRDLLNVIDERYIPQSTYVDDHVMQDVGLSQEAGYERRPCDDVERHDVDKETVSRLPSHKVQTAARNFGHHKHKYHRKHKSISDATKSSDHGEPLDRRLREASIDGRATNSFLVDSADNSKTSSTTRGQTNSLLVPSSRRIRSAPDDPAFSPWRSTYYGNRKSVNRHFPEDAETAVQETLSKWLTYGVNGADGEVPDLFIHKHAANREDGGQPEDGAIEMKVGGRRLRHTTYRQLWNLLTRGTSVRRDVVQNDGDTSDGQRSEQEDGKIDETAVDMFPPTRRTDGVALSEDDDDQPESPIEHYQFSDRTALRKSFIPVSASEQTVVRRSSKRGFNDIADMCVAHNCSGKMPGSFDYIRCMRQFRCT